jgi:hypothetical protein
VAALHFGLVSRSDLDPWLGGGFGMFSTAEPRHVHAAIVRDGDATPLPLEDDLDDRADRAEALPTAGRLESLADAIARSPEAAGGRVRVEVWRSRFDPRALRPRSELLRSVERSAGPG